MNDLFSLAGKNILITGAAQGIGYLLATGLGRYGARIIVNDITPERLHLLAMQTYACRTLGRSPGAYWRSGVSLVKSLRLC